MITIFYIIETILIYFYSLGFSLNARPHKRQRFNHHRVEIKVVVVVSQPQALIHYKYLFAQQKQSNNYLKNLHNTCIKTKHHNSIKHAAWTRLLPFSELRTRLRCCSFTNVC